jgi:hypothetical protein
MQAFPHAVGMMGEALHLRQGLDYLAQSAIGLEIGDDHVTPFYLSLIHI